MQLAIIFQFCLLQCFYGFSFGKTIIVLVNNHLWICETLPVNISISCFYYSYIKYQYFSLFDNFVMMYTYNNECLSLINGVVFI